MVLTGWIGPLVVLGVCEVVRVLTMTVTRGDFFGPAERVMVEVTKIMPVVVPELVVEPLLVLAWSRVDAFLLVIVPVLEVSLRTEELSLFEVFVVSVLILVLLDALVCFTVEDTEWDDVLDVALDVVSA